MAEMNKAVSLQTGIRQYNADITRYTGMLGGLTPDIHTLRSLNPETTNRVICVMYRGPWFLTHYFGGDNAWAKASEFATYKKLIEYYNMGIQCNIGDGSLAPITMQGGFAGRTVTVAGTQNTQGSQTLTITVPELVGRPVANFHNMWINGISDEITGLTTYHGLVAGSNDPTLGPQRIFAPLPGESTIALEPSPAWEVGEFLIMALDRSGARVEAAVMALGCYPAAKVGNDIFNSNAQGSSSLQTLSLTYNCQFIQSAYVNDLATRYLRQFAIFGNSLNLNPGAGDAFFKSASSTEIDTEIFNGGKRPDLDAVQSSKGNAPVFYANQQFVQRGPVEKRALQPEDHSRIYNNPDNYTDYTDIENPYDTTASSTD
jgi:hypothetical protein